MHTNTETIQFPLYQVLKQTKMIKEKRKGKAKGKENKNVTEAHVPFLKLNRNSHQKRKKP